jgi:hypothetical protein
MRRRRSISWDVKAWEFSRDAKNWSDSFRNYLLHLLTFLFSIKVISLTPIKHESPSYFNNSNFLNQKQHIVLYLSLCYPKPRLSPVGSENAFGSCYGSALGDLLNSVVHWFRQVKFVHDDLILISSQFLLPPQQLLKMTLSTKAVKIDLKIISLLLWINQWNRLYQSPCSRWF